MTEEQRVTKAATWLAKKLAQMEEDETIRCPYCDFAFESGEDYHDFISYHGEEGPQKAECSHCEGEFYVTEYITRTYEVHKTLENVNA